MLDVNSGVADTAALFLDDGDAVNGSNRLRQVDGPADIHYVASLELVVLTKRRGGMDANQIRAVRNLVHDIVSGQLGPCKFLVFDFAQTAADASRPGAGFEELITEVSDLIFQAPVVSIAWVHQSITGADLELALACSMIVGAPESSFVFGAELAGSLRSYALLAHRIGFVQAERLLEAGQELKADAMRDLMLLQAIVPAGNGLEPITGFVKGRMRRHNSACGIYRAQRIAMRGA